MSKVAYVAIIPKCNICDNPASVDGKTSGGQWAYMCPTCWEEQGCGQLGYGFGQELKLLSEKPKKKIDIQDLEQMVYGGEGATNCPEGCVVEPDGTCPHGYDSVLIELGFI